MENKTLITDSLGEFNGGAFLAKVDHALKDVALNVIKHEKKGKLVLELSFTKIKGTRQVQVSHAVKYQKPTLNGSSSEEDTTGTPMYVGKEGSLTLMPDNQMQMFEGSE